MIVFLIYTIIRNICIDFIKHYHKEAPYKHKYNSNFLTGLIVPEASTKYKQREIEISTDVTIESSDYGLYVKQ